MKSKKIKGFSLFESQKGNKYLHDFKNKQTLICHPIFHFLLQLKTGGGEPEQWFAQSHEPQIHIPQYGPVPREEVAYYLQKYIMLKNNDYFGDIDQQPRLAARMTPEDVKDSIANARIVTFEVTDRCNLRCQYCGYGKFYDDYDKRLDKDLDIDAAKKLLLYLRDAWNSNRNLSQNRNIYIGFYGGEPLLNFPFLSGIVSFAKKLEMSHNYFSFSMTTNGLLLDKYMDFIVEHDFNLLISLDGNEENNGYRVFKNGKPAYAKIMGNIQTLRRKYPDYFQEKVSFNAVLHNKNSVSQIFHFFKDNFSKHPSIGSLNTNGIKESQVKGFWDTYANFYDSLYNSEDYTMIEKEMFIGIPTVQEASTFLYKKSDCVFDNYNDLLFATEDAATFPTGTCLPFSKKIFVTVNGKILACERIGQQHGLGHVTPGAVTIDVETIAAQYNGYYDKLRNQCRLCYNTETCTQCIFNLDIQSDSPTCNGFMNGEFYSRRLAAHLDFFESDPGIYRKILKDVVID